MLGEQFYENKGRITNHGVLEVVEIRPKMETSFSAEDNNSLLVSCVILG
jgi:hypothetical protein